MPITAFAPPVQTATVSEGAAQPPAAGSVTHLPFPITLNGGLWTDPGGCVWYAPNGNSIGSAASGAAVANAIVEDLFKALWWHIVAATTGWSIQTSTGAASVAGATASDDWFAGKRLLIPDMRGRTIIGGGQGAGLTARAIGSRGGAETHALAAVENGAHSHSQNISRTTAGAGFYSINTVNEHSGTLAGNQSWTTESSGSGSPHNNMQPWAAYQELWSTGRRVSIESEQPASSVIGSLLVPSPVVGSAICLPYPVSLTAGLWLDENGFLWYAPNGTTIGGVGSGANVTSAKLEKLYKALWAHLASGTTGWSIQTSAGNAATVGATAAADWTASKRMVVPDQRGRGIWVGGAGAGLTDRPSGSMGGAESHAHALSDQGQARITPSSLDIDARRVAMASGTANHRSTLTSSSNTTSTHTLGVGLAGVTDTTQTLPPWTAYTILWSLGERA